MSRSELETKIVASLKNALAMPRKQGAVVITTTRARYYKAMTAMGFCDNNHTIYRGWQDCLDMAELELMAEAA